MDKAGGIHTAVMGSPIVTASDAELVVIGIERNATGVPRRIIVRTGWHRDPTIYYTRPLHRGTPDRAREVLWVTVDLQRNERMLIEAKPGEFQFFGAQVFAMDDRHFTVDSGHVLHVPPLPHVPPHVPVAGDPGDTPAGEVVPRIHRPVILGRWHYNITLESPKLGHTPLVLDPIIIIVEDP
jgi:hypothetical protein